MFDIVKLQTTVIKKVLKNQKAWCAKVDELRDDELFVMTESSHMFIVPQAQFFIDKSKLTPFDGARRIYKEAIEKTELAKSYETRVTTKGATVTRYANDKTSAWFDVDVLKAFGKNFNLFISSPYGVALVSDGEKDIGLIMPTKATFAEDEEDDDAIPNF